MTVILTVALVLAFTAAYFALPMVAFAALHWAFPEVPAIGYLEGAAVLFALSLLAAILRGPTR